MDLSICVYVYVCTCVCVYVCVYTYVRLHPCLSYVHVKTQYILRVCMCVCVCLQAGHFERLISIEISEQIAELARKRFANDKNVEIITVFSLGVETNVETRRVNPTPKPYTRNPIPYTPNFKP